jgi:hypothetical protein
VHMGKVFLSKRLKSSNPELPLIANAETVETIIPIGDKAAQNLRTNHFNIVADRGMRFKEARNM